MRIFELFETSPPAVVAPGAEIKPIPPGAKPSGDTPTPPTQASSAASSKPVPLQPTGFKSNVPQTQTSQQSDQSQAPQTDTNTTQQPQQPPAAVANQDSENIQNLQNQMQALMMKINQIQGTQMSPGAQ